MTRVPRQSSHGPTAYGLLVNGSTFVVTHARLVVIEVDPSDKFEPAAHIGLSKTAFRCSCTVSGERTSCEAIWDVDLPRRTRLVTCCSRSVNPYADMSSDEICGVRWVDDHGDLSRTG